MARSDHQPAASNTAHRDHAAEARTLTRTGLKCALATLDRTSGDPYVSLVTIATRIDGTPLLLISKLALHTQNLAADPRASLLFDGTGGAGDPLAGGRVTIMGQVRVSGADDDKRRFLTRHPAAEMYAGFPDFAFYALQAERAHYIGGFGRIVDLQPADLLIDLQDAQPLASAERDMIEHMNADHADAVSLYAEVILGKSPGPWRMSGIDPEGCDLVCEDRAARLLFDHRVASPEAARKAFISLVARARAATQ